MVTLRIGCARSERPSHLSPRWALLPTRCWRTTTVSPSRGSGTRRSPFWTSWACRRRTSVYQRSCHGRARRPVTRPGTLATKPMTRRYTPFPRRRAPYGRRSTSRRTDYRGIPSRGRARVEAGEEELPPRRARASRPVAPTNDRRGGSGRRARPLAPLDALSRHFL